MYRVIPVRSVNPYHMLRLVQFSSMGRTGTAAKCALPEVPGRLDVVVLADVDGRPSRVLFLCPLDDPGRPDVPLNPGLDLKPKGGALLPSKDGSMSDKRRSIPGSGEVGLSLTGHSSSPSTDEDDEAPSLGSSSSPSTPHDSGAAHAGP